MEHANAIAAALFSALVVLAGAAYALLYALAKVRHSAGWRLGSWVAYGLLVIFVIALVQQLELRGGWLLMAAAMLLGYGLAPVAIWRLSVGTHAEL